jgi:hypothetical protein
MNNPAALCAALIAAASLLSVASRAEDEPAAQVAPAAQASSGIAPTTAPSMPAPGRPRGVAPGVREGGASVAAVSGASVTAGTPAGQAAGAADGIPGGPASFASEEKWGMAGYNANEPIYTILVTSHDPRIIRCTADLKGTYIENGEKLPITDRQTITVFPNQQVQMGNWSGMDQQSGAVYSVKCRPV